MIKMMPSSKKLWYHQIQREELYLLMFLEFILVKTISKESLYGFYIKDQLMQYKEILVQNIYINSMHKKEQ